jgi:DNA-binding NarL/FixJ family response regulator
VGVIRIVLVDDQELVRTGFRLVLGGQPDMEVVGEAGDGVAAVAVTAQTRPDVVVMDVRMPRMDGVAATRQICSADDPPRVLILTTFDLDEYVYEAIKAGASGFLLKDTGASNLIDGIRIVHSGDAVVAPSTTRRLLDRFATLASPVRPADGPAGPAVPLTAREIEVLREIALGLSNAEIAARMYLSEATVRTHVSHILAKLGLRDRVQAVVYAYEMRLVRAGA